MNAGALPLIIQLVISIAPLILFGLIIGRTVENVGRPVPVRGFVGLTLGFIRLESCYWCGLSMKQHYGNKPKKRAIVLMIVWFTT